MRAAFVQEAATEFLVCAGQLRPGSATNGVAHTAACGKACFGDMDDGINLARGDVTALPSDCGREYGYRQYVTMWCAPGSCTDDAAESLVGPARNDPANFGVFF